MKGYTGKFSLDLKVGEQELEELKGAEILIGDNNLIAQILYKMPNTIKWVQSTWAGIDLYIKELVNNNNIAPNFVVTRFSGESFGQGMFDYCVAQIINRERDFFYNYENAKIKKIWFVLKFKIHSN
jgi:phosphoglycerate dehydrogenase-like enzyme